MAPVQASKEWVEANFSALREDVREAKAIGIEARKLASKPHECQQKEEIRMLRTDVKSIIEEIGNWKFFKRLFFVALAIVLGSMVGTVSFFVNTSSAVATNSNKMQSSVGQLTHKHEMLVHKVENMVEEAPHKDREQIKEFRRVLQEELEDFQSFAPPRKRGR